MWLEDRSTEELIEELAWRDVTIPNYSELTLRQRDLVDRFVELVEDWKLNEAEEALEMVER
jgi:hypothetical protein